MAIRRIVTTIILLIAIASCTQWLLPLSFLVPAGLAEPRIGPPACLAPRGMTVFGDGFLRFQAPNGVPIDVDRSVDATQLQIAGPSRTSRLVLAEGVDGADRLEAIRQFGSRETDRQVQQTNHDGLMVLDIKVRKSDGSHSRLIGMVLQTAFYESASDDDAAFFDQIMDSACFWYPYVFPNWLVALGPNRSGCGGHLVIRSSQMEECLDRH